MNPFRLSSLAVMCAMLTLASCGSHTDSTQTFRGTVTRLTADQLQLTTSDSDTLTFGTADLDSTTRADILPADMVEVLAVPTAVDGDTTYQAQTVLVRGRSLIRALSGCWTEPIPGTMDGQQGIQFNEDGTAGSVGMATLVFQTWCMPRTNTIVLGGESIGNGQTIAFSDTLTLTKLTADSLVLSRADGKAVWRLGRQE